MRVRLPALRGEVRAGEADDDNEAGERAVPGVDDLDARDGGGVHATPHHREFRKQDGEESEDEEVVQDRTRSSIGQFSFVRVGVRNSLFTWLAKHQAEDGFGRPSEGRASQIDAVPPVLLIHAHGAVDGWQAVAGPAIGPLAHAPSSSGSTPCHFPALLHLLPSRGERLLGLAPALALPLRPRRNLLQGA